MTPRQIAGYKRKLNRFSKSVFDKGIGGRREYWGNIGISFTIIF